MERCLRSQTCSQTIQENYMQMYVCVCVFENISVEEMERGREEGNDKQMETSINNWGIWLMGIRKFLVSFLQLLYKCEIISKER